MRIVDQLTSMTSRGMPRTCEPLVRCATLPLDGNAPAKNGNISSSWPQLNEARAISLLVFCSEGTCSCCLGCVTGVRIEQDRVAEKARAERRKVASMRNEDQNFYYKREWSRVHERAGTFALA